MLFQLYINDINNAIIAQIKNFADDNVTNRNIRNQNDQVILQHDLDTISSRAEKWLMVININKHSVLSITVKCNSSFHDHNILGTTPKWATNHGHLGVTISSHLNWLKHVKKFKTRIAEPLSPANKT